MAEHAAQSRDPARRLEPASAPNRALAKARPVAALGQLALGLNAHPQVASLKALGDRLSARPAREPVQRAALPANRTGMPDALKQGVEALSGLSMDDVRVHRNSARPAQLQAHAYAQGSAIHLAPGQDHHLPHEAWHVVQQKQGRVRATVQLKGGVAANTDRGLEREADVMGARAVGTRPGGAAPMRAPMMSGTQPVQCQLWRWNAARQAWDTVGASSSTATPPAHQGVFDGQQYDDTPYTQATDPTVIPFLGSGEDYLGHRAAQKQLSGRAPTATDVRVPAVKGPGLVRGSGLHEVVPTYLGPQVGRSGNEALIGAQSGFRTSTSQQLFNIDGGDVGAHIGFAPKPGSRGYTHTRGQWAKHVELGNTAQDIITNNVTHPDDVINAVALRHLEVTPHGQAILASPYLQGLVPNNRSSLGPVGPASTGGAPDPQRLAIAQEAHRGRERVKRRARTHKRTKGRGRSPSPPRTPIDALGGGGGYIATPTLDDEVEAEPQLPDSSNAFEYTANVGAWITQPQRF